MPLLFGYGTLLDPGIQQSVIGRCIEGSADMLSSFRKTTVTIGTEIYPDLVAEAGASVEGRVLEVTDQELSKMDEYEGKEYRRMTVTLVSGMPAEVYLTNEEWLH